MENSLTSRGGTGAGVRRWLKKYHQKQNQWYQDKKYPVDVWHYVVDDHLDGNDVLTGHQGSYANQDGGRTCQEAVISQTENLLDRKASQEPFDRRACKNTEDKDTDEYDIYILDKITYLDRADQLKGGNKNG